jgi:glycolate oxidase FAD binding subunit
VIAAGPDEPQPLVEWHGGQRWYLSSPGAGDRWRAAARAAGGHATLFRRARAAEAGVSAQPAVQRFDTLSPVLARIHQALQREFDPAGIFRRGPAEAPLRAA